MFTILVVEDDAKLRQLFCTVLTRHGYRTVPAVNGEDALAMLDKEYIDLMICDIMMPVMDGFELTRMIRDNNSQLPVLMVTARENFADKQQGFLVGIDDYMVKPVNVNEMLLRVGALLRRAKIISERKIEWAETVLDYDTLTVIQGPERIVLPQKEFYLLYKMISYPNKIFTKQQLMDEIWGWTPSRMSIRWWFTLTGCVSVSGTIRILKSSRSEGLAIRR